MDNENPSARLPLIVKVAIMLTIFNSWVLFEETVVDRHGLWRYLPFYKVGIFCAWDMLAIAAILLGAVVYWHWRPFRACPLRIGACLCHR
jgi:hypothetical protein